MYGIFTYIWMISMVNVGKYTIHGSYGLQCVCIFGLTFFPYFSVFRRILEYTWMIMHILSCRFIPLIPYAAHRFSLLVGNSVANQLDWTANEFPGCQKGSLVTIIIHLGNMFPLIMYRTYIHSPFVDNYFIDIFDQENYISMGSCFSSTYSAIPLEYLQVKRYQPPARESPHFHPNCGRLWESPGWFWKKSQVFHPPQKTPPKKASQSRWFKWCFYPYSWRSLNCSKGSLFNNPQKGSPARSSLPGCGSSKKKNPALYLLSLSNIVEEKSKNIEVCGFRSHLLDHHQFSTSVLEGENMKKTKRKHCMWWEMCCLGE